jgi:hypothetical protein
MMTDPIQDWDSHQSVLDHILYREPSGLIRQLDVRDGATRMDELITFADGSQIAVSARVPLPPLDDMTPKQVTFLKLNGERGERLDDGSSEAMDLACQSIAIRLLERISRILDGMPEIEKMACPRCSGERVCSSCKGSGCMECQESGICSDCSGFGMVAKE